MKLADLLEEAMEDGTFTSVMMGEAMDPKEREGEEPIRMVLGVFGNKDNPPPADEDRTREFIAFLRACGGFEIW